MNNRSSVAGSPAERERHMTKASTETVVPSKGKCHRLMGKQEMPIQSASCNVIQQPVLIARVWMLWWVRYWLLGWGFGKQQ